MAESASYLLGHSGREWDRLAAQHDLWRDTLLELLPDAGTGAHVLDAGCGTGCLLRDLALRVGPSARVVGIERDAAACEAAAAAVSDLPWAAVIRGDLERAPVLGTFDLIVSRWVFSFLREPGAVLDRLAGALRPGGVLIIQDYQHDGFRLFPERPAVQRAIEALRAAYRAAGGDLWIAGRLPQLLAARGFDLAGVHPRCMAGPPDSPVFQWIERFLHDHAAGWVARGHLTPAEREAFEQEWAEAREVPGAVVVSPIVTAVVARRP